MSAQPHPPAAPPHVAFWRSPKLRSLVYQLVALALILWVGVEFALNASANLKAQKIATGFGFLENTAGFGVNQSLIDYREADSYGRVFLRSLPPMRQTSARADVQAFFDTPAPA